MLTSATIFQGDYDYPALWRQTAAGLRRYRRTSRQRWNKSRKPHGIPRKTHAATDLRGFGGSAVSCQSLVCGRSQSRGQGGCGWDLWGNDDIAKDCGWASVRGGFKAEKHSLKTFKAPDYTAAHPFASATHPLKTHRQPKK